MARSQNKLVFKPRTCRLRFSRRQKISPARHGQTWDVFCPGRITSKRLFLNGVRLFRCVSWLRKAKRLTPRPLRRSERNQYWSTSSYAEAVSEVSRKESRNALWSVYPGAKYVPHAGWRGVITLSICPTQCYFTSKSSRGRTFSLSGAVKKGGGP